LRHDAAAGIRDALELGTEAGSRFPTGDSLSRVLADAPDLEQLGFGGSQDGGRIAEVFEQLPHANRADVLDQIQRHQGFMGLHAGRIQALGEPCKVEIAGPEKGH
jgi:hypothetical protein